MRAIPPISVRQAAQALAVLAATTASVALALAGQQRLPDDGVRGSLLLGAGALFFVAVIWRAAPVVRLPLLPVPGSAAWRWRLVALAAATTLPLTVVVLVLFHLERWPWFLDVLWVASVGMALWWAWRLDRGPAVSRDETATWTLVDVAALGVVLGAATFLRVWQVPNLPAVIGDEGHGLRDAHLVLEGTITTPFTSGHSSTGTIFEFILAGQLLLGIPDETALKLMGIVPGVLTVLFLYLLLRELFGPLAAAIGAFLAATSSWQLMLTRWGHVYGYDELFAVAGLYFIARGLRTLNHVDFALAGLSFGLALVLLKSAATAPLMLLAVAAIVLWRYRTRAFATFGTQAALMLLVIVAVFAPRALYIVENQDEALKRPREVFLFNNEHWADGKNDPWLKMARNMKELALTFNVESGHQTRWNTNPKEPTLDIVAAALLVLGVTLAVARLRDWRYLLMLALGAAVLIPAATAIPLDDRPVTYRLAGGMPMVYGLAGVALALMFAAQRSLWARAIAGAGVAALLAVSAAVSFDKYFNDWGDSVLVWYATGQVDTRVGRHVDRLGDDYHIYISSIETAYFPTIRAIAWDTEFTELRRAADLNDLELPDDGKPLAIVMVEPAIMLGVHPEENMQEVLNARFPDGTLVDGEADPRGRRIYSTLFVDAESARR